MLVDRRFCLLLHRGCLYQHQSIAIEHSPGKARNDNVELADSANIVLAGDTIAATRRSIDLANIDCLQYEISLQTKCYL